MSRLPEEGAIVWSDDDEPIDGTLVWSDDEEVDVGHFKDKLSFSREPKTEKKAFEGALADGPYDVWRRQRDQVTELSRLFDGLESLAKSAKAGATLAMADTPVAKAKEETAAERSAAMRREAQRPTLLALEARGSDDAADATFDVEMEEIDGKHAATLAKMERKQALALQRARESGDSSSVAVAAAETRDGESSAAIDDDDDSWSAFF